MPNNQNARYRSQLKIKYGITIDDYFDILCKQKHLCAICGKKMMPASRFTHVDHNHKTKKVRGILCQRCNCLLGFACEDTAILKSAIKYLRKFT
jgi:hypothetical protein